MNNFLVALSNGESSNLKNFAGFLGWIIVIAFALALGNYILKYINKRWGAKLKKYNKNLYDIYTKFMKYVIKYHKIVGSITIIFILAHAIIMYSIKGWRTASTTGLVAAILMLVLVALGAYGSFVSKKRTAPWFKAHKIVSVMVIISIIVHLL